MLTPVQKTNHVSHSTMCQKSSIFCYVFQLYQRIESNKVWDKIIVAKVYDPN